MEQKQTPSLYEDIKKFSPTYLTKVIKVIDDISVIKRYSILVKILSILLYPIRKISDKTDPGVYGKIGKLIEHHKYGEGYLIGLDRLSNWKKRKRIYLNNEYGHVDMLWWLIYENTCLCAVESYNKDSFVALRDILVDGPQPRTGYCVAQAYCQFVRLALKSNDLTTAWEWAEKCIQADTSYGYGYYLRAGIVKILEKGNPLEDLIMAIRNQPDMESCVFADPLFQQSPELLSQLKERLGFNTAQQCPSGKQVG